MADERPYAYRSLVRSPNGYMRLVMIDELSGEIIPNDAWDNYQIRGVDGDYGDTSTEDTTDEDEEDDGVRTGEEITEQYVNSSADNADRGGPSGLSAEYDSEGRATSYTDRELGNTVVSDVPEGWDIGYKAQDFIGNKVADSRVTDIANTVASQIGKALGIEVDTIGPDEEQEAVEQTAPNEAVQQSANLSDVATGIAQENTAVDQGPAQEAIATDAELAAIDSAKEQGYGSLAAQSQAQTAAQNAQQAANPGFGVGQQSTAQQSAPTTQGTTIGFSNSRNPDLSPEAVAQSAARAQQAQQQAQQSAPQTGPSPAMPAEVSVNNVAVKDQSQMPGMSQVSQPNVQNSLTMGPSLYDPEAMMDLQGSLAAKAATQGPGSSTMGGTGFGVESRGGFEAFGSESAASQGGGGLSGGGFADPGDRGGFGVDNAVDSTSVADQGFDFGGSGLGGYGVGFGGNEVDTESVSEQAGGTDFGGWGPDAGGFSKGGGSNTGSEASSTAGGDYGGGSTGAGEAETDTGDGVGGSDSGTAGTAGSWGGESPGGGYW